MRGRPGSKDGRSSGAGGYLGVLIIFVIFASLWEAASRFGLAHPSVLPPFSTVLVTAAGLLHDPGFLSDLGATARAVAVAYAIAAPLAMITGLTLGAGGVLARRATSFLYVALAVPHAVFLPLFVLTLGVTFLQKVVFAVVLSFVIICLTAVAAARSVDPDLVRVARAFGAGRWQLWSSVHLPCMAPVLVAGLRYGLIFTTVGVLISEMYGARHGVGPLVVLWGETFQMRLLIAGILIVAALTLAANAVVRRAERAVGHWRHAGDTPLRVGT